MDSTSLFIGLFTGLLGTAYFIYGKKQRKMVPMLSGIALCLVPYLFNGWLSSTVVSVVLCALPLAIKL
jgi:hypothetical protein